MLFRLPSTATAVAAILTASRLSCTATAEEALTSSLPLEATEETPWEDLAASVGDHLSGPTNLTEWSEQCVDPFKILGLFPGYEGYFAVVSNYYLLNQTSGLCLDHVSCAFLNCIWPTAEGIAAYPNFPSDASSFALPAGEYNVLDSISGAEAEPLYNFPARVLNPKSVKDIVHAVNFARANQVGITIKVNGHSYLEAPQLGTLSSSK